MLEYERLSLIVTEFPVSLNSCCWVTNPSGPLDPVMRSDTSHLAMFGLDAGELVTVWDLSAGAGRCGDHCLSANVVSPEVSGSVDNGSYWQGSPRYMDWRLDLDDLRMLAWLVEETRSSSSW